MFLEACKYTPSHLTPSRVKGLGRYCSPCTTDSYPRPLPAKGLFTYLTRSRLLGSRMLGFHDFGVLPGDFTDRWNGTSIHSENKGPLKASSRSATHGKRMMGSHPLLQAEWCGHPLLPESHWSTKPRDLRMWWHLETRSLKRWVKWGI